MPGGYPWSQGDLLLANDLNAAIANSVALGGSVLPLTGGTMIGPLNWTSTNTPASRAAQDRTADVVNVKDFGAKGDGTTDDAAAINAAIAHAVSVLSGSITVEVYLPPGVYRCNGSVNLTGIRAYNAGMFSVSGSGATIQSHATGAPAVDATWSQCLHIDGLIIGGDATNTPTYGLQLGIKDTTGAGNAADWRVTNLTVSGYFSQAAIWNVGAETGLWTGLRISNGHATGDGIRMDGINHFGLSSAFQTVSLPTDSFVSFNDNLFVGPIVQVQAGRCLWLAGNAGTRFDNGYGSTAGANAVALFSHSGSDTNKYVRVHMHFETISITDVFLITGPYATPNLAGFEYVDFLPEATNSIFKLDATVTQCAFIGVNLRINDGVGGWTKVFDNQAAWNFVSGNVLMELSSTEWNLSNARFAGLLMNGINTSVVANTATLVQGFGLFNGAPVTTKPTVTGAKGSNAALGSLLVALAAYGLVTDSTSA